MKKRLAGVVGVIVAVAALFTGCGDSKPVLYLYNWSDYMSPSVIAQFEAQNGCRVVVDTFDSNESMFAKLEYGASGYDIVFPSAYFVEMMNRRDMLQPLDRSKLPNVVNIDKSLSAIMTDPTFKISVPYMISSAGIAYNVEKCKDFIPSWSVFGQEQYRGKATLLDDLRETIGAALKTLGHSMNTTNEAQIAEAVALVIKWKRTIAKFENEQYKNGIASGQYVFVHGYSGDLAQVIEENDNIVFVYPREGTSLCSDEMVIPKGAKNVELAHKFINFMHDPEVAAQNMQETCYLCPNTNAYELLPEEFRKDEMVFPPKEIISKSEAIRDLGEGNLLYIKAWEQIKAAE